MNRWAASALVSIVYWFGALTIMGLVTIIHGECFDDAACGLEKQRIATGGLIVAALIFPIIVGIVFRQNSAGKN